MQRAMRNRLTICGSCAYVLAAALGGWGAGAILGLVTLMSGLVTVGSTAGDFGETWRLNAFKMLGLWGLIGAVLASILVFWNVCWSRRGTGE
jgi:hypothetical protein